MYNFQFCKDFVVQRLSLWNNHFCQGNSMVDATEKSAAVQEVGYALLKWLLFKERQIVMILRSVWLMYAARTCILDVLPFVVQLAKNADAASKKAARWLVRVHVFVVCGVFCFRMILEVLGKPRMIMDMLTNAQETMHTSAESLQSFTRSERGWGGWPVIWNVLMLWSNIASQLVCFRRLCVILPPTWKCNFVRHGATIHAAHICVD